MTATTAASTPWASYRAQGCVCSEEPSFIEEGGMHVNCESKCAYILINCLKTGHVFLRNDSLIKTNKGRYDVMRKQD